MPETAEALEIKIVRGDVIRYRFEHPGVWERWFSAMVVEVKKDYITVVTDRDQRIIFTRSDIARSDIDVIFRTSRDSNISKGQVFYRDLSNEQKGRLNDVTKNAIRGREKEAEARLADTEASSFLREFRTNYGKGTGNSANF